VNKEGEKGLREELRCHDLIGAMSCEVPVMAVFATIVANPLTLTNGNLYVDLSPIKKYSLMAFYRTVC
jgi:hypothetical protein